MDKHKPCEVQVDDVEEVEEVERIPYNPEFRRRLRLTEVKIVDLGEDLRRAYMVEH